jgi:hypothetical protein
MGWESARAHAGKRFRFIAISGWRPARGLGLAHSGPRHGDHLGLKDPKIRLSVEQTRASRVVAITAACRETVGRYIGDRLIPQNQMNSTHGAGLRGSPCDSILDSRQQYWSREVGVWRFVHEHRFDTLCYRLDAGGRRRQEIQNLEAVPANTDAQHLSGSAAFARRSHLRTARSSRRLGNTITTDTSSDVSTTFALWLDISSGR